MRNTVMGLIGAVAAGIVAFSVTRQWHAQPTRWAPFTAVMVQRDYEPNALEPDHVENYIYGRKEDGSWVKVFKREFPDGQWRDVRVVFDLATRRRVTIDPATESVVTYAVRSGEPGGLAAGVACTSQTGAERGRILGYEVIRAHREFARGAGEVWQQDSWLAPALNCFALKESATYGPPLAPYRSTREALWVAAGAPDASWFEVPPRYAEGSPSEVMAEFSRRFPAAAAPAERAAAGLDEVYRSLK